MSSHHINSTTSDSCSADRLPMASSQDDVFAVVWCGCSLVRPSPPSLCRGTLSTSAQASGKARSAVSWTDEFSNGAQCATRGIERQSMQDLTVGPLAPMAHCLAEGGGGSFNSHSLAQLAWSTSDKAPTRKPVRSPSPPCRRAASGMAAPCGPRAPSLGKGKILWEPMGPLVETISSWSKLGKVWRLQSDHLVPSRPGFPEGWSAWTLRGRGSPCLYCIW